RRVRRRVPAQVVATLGDQPVVGAEHRQAAERGDRRREGAQESPACEVVDARRGDRAVAVRGRDERSEAAVAADEGGSRDVRTREEKRRPGGPARLAAALNQEPARLASVEN